MNRAVLYALCAAALFGASTPFAKLLTGDTPPVLLAGLLYLGSGLGLSLARVIRDRGVRPSGLPKGDWPWLLGAIFFGGMLGPVALMFGLLSTSGSTASLLLNLEALNGMALSLTHMTTSMQNSNTSMHIFRTFTTDIRIHDTDPSIGPVRANRLRRDYWLLPAVLMAQEKCVSMVVDCCRSKFGPVRVAADAASTSCWTCVCRLRWGIHRYFSLVAVVSRWRVA